MHYSECRTFQNTDKDGHVRSLALAIAVQADGCAQTIAMFGGCECRAEQCLQISRLRLLQFARVIFDAPEHRVVRDFFEISDAPIHALDEINVLHETSIVLVQPFFVLHCEAVDQFYVIDDIALVMFGQFLATAL